MNRGELAVAYGKRPYDLVLTVLQEMDIASELSPSDHVLLKPNLVMAREASSGVTTHPQLVDRVILGKDPVLVDSYVAELMGYPPEVIRHIALAAQYGVGVMDTLSAQIREIGQPDFVKIPPQGRSELDRLKEYILDRQACSACYGSTLYALQRLSETNQLSRLRKKICVGQGYRSLRMSDLGIGVCTRGFQSFVNGCPPKARDIFEFLQSSLS